jgi:hypothetical protein
MLFAINGMAQPDLLPHIGMDNPPLLSDQVCEIGNYYEISDWGYEIGETVNDFTVYSCNQEEFTLSDALADDEPVLLISGSYTCPRFRNAVADMNTIGSLYADEAYLVVIYTVEAHPHDEVSPFTGSDQPDAQNLAQGINYSQPTIFSERLEIIGDMKGAMNLDFELFVDGPCNQWVETFGPAANLAYIIGTDGTVFARHDWFNIFPNNIYDDLDAYLDLEEEEEEEEDPVGTFDFNLTSGNTISGNVGETIFNTAEITNNSEFPVVVHCERVISELPQGWGSAMCLDVCLPPYTESYDLWLDAGASQSFKNYFYTTDNPGSGFVRLEFSNDDDSTNVFVVDFTGLTEAIEPPDPEDSHDLSEESDATDTAEFDAMSIDVYPNPAVDFITVKGAFEQEVSIFNLAGTLVLKLRADHSKDRIDVSDWQPGVYLVCIPEMRQMKRLVVK